MEHTHAYGSWVVVDEPTCTEEGLRERTCSCGEKETEKIAALGHTAGEAVKESEKAPTCTTAGSYEKVVYCTVCEEELSRKSVTVDALEHDYKGVVTDEPHCITNGEKTYTCTRCGDSYTETIDALGHGWGETKPGQAPTCTTAGYTSYKTCLRCGYTTRETIPALQHDWSEWTVTTPAECEKEGENTRTCSRCQETQTQTIAALDHDWSEWKVTTAATCTEMGEQTRTCSRCQETQTQTIAALDHDWSAYSVDETNHWRTCTREGCSFQEEAAHSFTRNTCEICGYAFCSKGLGYEVNGDTVTITGSGSCSDTSIYIPAVIEGKPVTEIGTSAFQYCTSLEKIVIPDSVTTIGDYAFSDCDELTTVYYRGSEEQWDSITIGQGNDALTEDKIIYNYTGE